MPKISVILPVYNGGDYLDASIKSIMSQTFKDFELIIVDDCSVDDTPDIAQKYVQEFTNVVYVRNDVNLKLPRTLNKGFALATGQYWTWTSCDNIYQPNAFACLINAIDTNVDVGLVYADMEIINEAGEITSQTLAGPAEDLIYRNVVGACFLYCASIAKQVGEYNPHMFLCEDYDYWLRIGLVTKILPLHKTLYLYRCHKKSLSHKYEGQVISKGKALQKQYYKQYVDTRSKAAYFYAYLRARDIYNPFRQFYLLLVLYYNPLVFIEACYKILRGRLSNA